MHHNYDNNEDKNIISKRNKILHSSSLVNNSILLFPSALGIEIICILSSITGESLGFYLFGFNIVGIIYAYSLGFILAGFTIFLVILGRYREIKISIYAVMITINFLWALNPILLPPLSILKMDGIACHFYFIIKIGIYC